MPLTIGVARDRGSFAQAAALGRAVWWEFTWGLPQTALLVRRARARAKRIPDPLLRADALHALDTKRGYADGAALFSTLAPRRRRDLVVVLVSIEVIVDYLDNVSERCPTYDNGQQLHLALVDALDPSRPMRDYYRHHLARDDGGYLAALVDACRRAVRTLPSYEQLRPYLLREARSLRVLGLNHEPDPALRDAGLRDWVAAEHPDEDRCAWWELTGAASATLHLHALLALAGTPAVDDATIAAVQAAHWPWIALATTLLDAYVDLEADHAAGAHSYLDHYRSLHDAADRTAYAAEQAVRHASAAPHGHRHAVIVACMIALYLSAPAAHDPALERETTRILRASGPLARAVVPALSAWRRFYRQTT